MTEKEKMLKGEYYLGWDADLTKDREVAKDILFEFNAIKPSDREKRTHMIEKLFGSVGKGVWIESPFNCDFGSHIFAGDNFYTNANCCIFDCATVTIGNNVLFGPNVSIYTPNHALNHEERALGYEKSLPVKIGDNVWVGGSVSILGGVTIGENSIIGAGSVVTKDIPANVIAVGSPCKVVREITPEDKLNLK